MIETENRVAVALPGAGARWAWRGRGTARDPGGDVNDLHLAASKPVSGFQQRTVILRDVTVTQ